MKIPKYYLIILVLGLVLMPSPGQSYIQWTVRTSIPTARSHFGCETYNGLVYCYGGSIIWSFDSMTTAHEVFNPVTNTWSTAAPMINQRKAFGTTSLNNLFYAIGGIDTITGSNGSVLNERYNPVANNWTTLASMPTGRYGCSAAAANGRVYVFGGQIGPVGSGNTNANEEYNPGTNIWQARASMPESLRYTGAVNFNNLIYVYGGSRNSGIKNEFVYVYNPTSNTWSQAAGTMPTPRSTLMPDSMRNFMMTVGGAYGASTETNVAEFYYPGTGTWVSETPMNYARFAPGFVRVDSFVYGIGGTYGSGEYPYNYTEGGLYINVALLVDPDQNDSILPGATRAYTLTVTNQGDHNDVIDVTTSGTLPGWTVALYQSNNVDTLTDTDADGIKDVGSVPRLGGTRNFVVRVTAPGSAPAGQTDITTIRGASSIDIQKFDNAVLTTRVRGVTDIIVIPDTSGATLPAVAVNYLLRAVNNGNLSDTVNLSTFHTSVGWTAQLFDSAGATPITRIAVSAFGGIGRFTLRVTPDDTVVAGFRDTTYVRGVSNYNPVKSDTARVITLINGFAGVLLDPDTLGFTGPGTPITYTLRVTNNGNVNDTFNLASTGTKPGWTAQILDTLNNPITYITIPPYGGMRRMRVRIDPPDTINAGVRDTTLVRGTSRFNSGVFDNARVITEITGFASLLVEPDTSGSTLPGVAVNYNLRAINNGNVPDTVNLSSFHTSIGWTAQILDSAGSAPVTRLAITPYGGLRRFMLRITPDDTVVAGFRDTTYVRGISTYNASVRDSCRVITLINGFAAVVVDPDTQANTLPGVPVTYTLRVTNNGNVSDTFNLTSSGTKPGWTAQILDTLNNPISIILVPPYGGLRRLRVRVTPPDTVNQGVRDTTFLRGTSRFNPAVYDNARLITVISGFASFLVEPDTIGGTSPGVPVNYAMRVINNGNVADTINFSTAHTLPLWTAELLDSTGSIPITRLAVGAWGGVRRFVLRIHPPDTVLSGTQDTTFVRGISTFNGAVRDSARVITAIGSFASILIVPDTVGYTNPGVVVNYPLRAVNDGNVPDTVNLSSFHTSVGWTAQILDSTGSAPITRLAVAPYGGVRRFLLRITPDDTVVAGFRDTTYVRGASTYNPIVRDSAQVITVINGFAGVSLDPDTLGFTGPGVPITYALRIRNNGNVNDTFNLVSSGTKPGWNAVIMDTLDNPIPWITVPAYGGQRNIRVRVTPPDTVNMGVRDTTTVTGTSRFNPAVSDNARLITEINGFAAVLIEPDTTGMTLPGVAVNYNLRAINNGNVPDTVNLSSFHTSVGWTAQILDSTGSAPIIRLAVAPYGALRRFMLRITPDDTVVAGFRDTTYMRGVSTYNPTVRDSARVITQILAVADLSIVPDTTGAIDPGDTIRYALRVTNNGNAAERASISLNSIHPAGWISELFDTLGNPIDTVFLLPWGQMQRVILRVIAPVSAGSTERDSSIATVRSSVNPALTDQVTVVTRIGMVAIIIVDPDQQQTGLPRDTVRYRLAVDNLGSATDIVDLSLSSTQGWALTPITDTLGNPLPDANSNGRPDLTLASGARGWIVVRVRIPNGTATGTQDVTTVLGESNNVAGVHDEARLTTVVRSEILSMVVDPDAERSIPADSTFRYPLYLVVNANSPDTVDLNVTAALGNWHVQIRSPSDQVITRLPALPHDTTRFQLVVTAPALTIVGPIAQIIDSCVSVITGTSRLNDSISDIATVITHVVPNLDVHNFSSPFRVRDGTSFIMSLPERGAVTITVYNRLGEKVKTVLDGQTFQPGIHVVPWNGLNDAGNRLVPGVYLYVFKFNGDTLKDRIFKKKTAVYAD